MLKDKGGFLRVLEAVIAVLLVAGAVTIILVKNVQVDDNSETVKQIQQIILEEISTNPELRTAVLNCDSNSCNKAGISSNSRSLNNSISSLMPPEYNYEFTVCLLDEICTLSNSPGYYTKGDIYADEVSVAATLEIAPDPKKLRLFMWLKE